MISKKRKLDFKTSSLSLVKRHSVKFKTATIFALLISTVTLNLGFANETSKDEFDKIFHVYVGNSYIGAVADEAAVQQIIEQKEKEASNQFKELTVDAGSNIKIIPEQVFSVDTDEQATLKKLQDSIKVHAQAYSIQVDGNDVAFLKNENEFEAAINGLKLQYVSPTQLSELDARPATASLPPLKDSETRIVDVKLSTEVKGEQVEVTPAEIVTVNEAIQLLQTGSIEKELYAVQAGDVLGSIAKAHNLTTAELIQLNPSITAESVLQIGQQLNVTVEKPYVSVKAIYEKKQVEAVDFTKVVKEDATMLKGKSVVKQEGAIGKKEVSYVISEENGVRTERVQTDEKMLVEPEDRIVVIGTKVVPSIGTGTFAWPANGGRISSQMGTRWGRYHYGIDIARPSNYTIKASDNGTVKTAGRHATYGNYIVINHNNGYETLYAHLSKIGVKVGQVVEKGSSIGVMGSTGRSTGTHLHFEVHKNGSEENPLAYLN
ncbi:M23 family metallopeptidase [Solibacillus sp. FSL K6-1523]|uniref:M23 family metallopeptidase n=1 Tax=Solibacillus sp. FSL K6-1523 TaxID=2921471 RepID=UPI0030F6ED26